jgi:molybdenum cofactor cytidylyltransferase
MRPEANIAAVLVAAGESQRMGASNKLLLPIDGVPMVRHTATRLLAAEPAELVVVVGHEAARVADALAGLPIRWIDNADYQQGQAASVNVGLKALSDPGAAVMICLADMPWLASYDYRWLMHHYRHHCTLPIALPCHEDHRGNPVIISSEVRKQVLEGGASVSCRKFIDGHPELVQRVTVDHARYHRDIDTPADYQRWPVSTGSPGAAPEKKPR